MTYEGACHCGAVSFVVDDTPARLVSCNCSACRRFGALWFHTLVPNVTFSATPEATIAYAWGDKMLAFQTCKTCGATTHYLPLDGSERMAVNMRMVDPAAIDGIPVRHFDGADSWTFLD
ncbi:MAG: GFA family protein [Pseudomonadota bacterium]